MRRSPTAPLLLLAGLALGGPTLAGPAAATSLCAPTADDDVERATAWPEPDDKAALADALNNLRKAELDEHVAEWTDALVAIGPAAAPRILRAFTREKSDANKARFVAVLDAITAPEHTRLLAEEFGSKSIDVRLFAIRRVTELGDPGLQGRAEALWAQAVKDSEKRAKDRKKRKSNKDTEPRAQEEFERVGLLALSTGSVESLDHEIELAGSKEYGTWRADLEAAARAGGAANARVGDLLAGKMNKKVPAAERAGALRLLAHAGTKEHVPAIGRMLEAKENHVKIAAINALRRIVDGAEPLDKLSTFEAIEKAKAWKARI